MKILSDWGFTPEGWRTGDRGEYLVLLQAVLLIGFVLLPVYQPAGLNIDKSSNWWYGIELITAMLALAAIILITKGLIDLGNNLTPLPYPKTEGKLIQTGIYGIVRHPLYSGIIFAALAWAIFQLSLSHLIGAVILFIFLNSKASREETWLTEKYPNYAEYQQRVKKIIPGFY